jgi:hypothetical protein
MPVTGLYMTRRVHHSAIPYVGAYCQCVLRDVLPTFSALSERANEIVNAEFNRLGSQPAGEASDGDMSAEAEKAQEAGQAFYNTMFALRQTTLNLFATGLFHLLEQQLADLCRDGTFHKPPPRDTKLSIVAKWYQDHFDLNLKSLSAWPMIEQLQLIANSVKHGEGDSAKKLRARRPDLFRDPSRRALSSDVQEMLTPTSLRRPMAGEDLFVTERAFAEYAEASNAFVAAIAEHFAAHAEQHYLVGSSRLEHL